MRTLTILSLFIISSFMVQADELQDAFKKSYELEYAGSYAEAITVLKAKYQEDHYPSNLRLAWLHYLNGLYSESATYYNKAKSLKPYSVEAKLGLVSPLSAMGEWDKVITCYEDILKIDAQNSTANYRLGSIYYARKDYKTAFSHLEKAINLYPFDYDIMSLMAWTYFQLGKMTEAKALFQQVLLYQPEDESALEGLSLIK